MHIKKLLLCLLIVCIAYSAWGSEHETSLVELVKKLEKAKDLPRDRMEALLKVKFTLRSDAHGFRWYETEPGRLSYGKELIAESIAWRFSKNKKTYSLRVHLNNESGCIKQQDIEKLYPNGDFFNTESVQNTSYVNRNEWGNLVFDFGQERNFECLTAVKIRTNKLLKLYGEEPYSNWSLEQEKSLANLVQKLEKAEGLPRNKVETLLNIKFNELDFVSGRFVHGKDLIASMISVRYSKDTATIYVLEVHLDNDESVCFTRKGIEKLYPNGDIDLFESSAQNIYYTNKKPWGNLVFGFGEGRDFNCLTDIEIETNEFLKLFEKKS